MNDISDNSSNSLANGGTVANSGIPKDGTGLSLHYSPIFSADLVPETDTEDAQVS